VVEFALLDWRRSAAVAMQQALQQIRYSTRMRQQHAVYSDARTYKEGLREEKGTQLHASERQVAWSAAGRRKKIRKKNWRRFNLDQSSAKMSK